MSDDTDGGTPTLAGLGEFGVIDRLIANRRQPSSVVVGPGDDAAVVTAADGRTVVSTDMLVEGRHFRLDWSTPHDIGRKAIAQNAADIEAMGAVATAFVVSFGAPGDTAAEDALALSDGMWAEADRSGAGIAGGDLVTAPQWVVSVTALGDLAGRALGRSAAGYQVCLTGAGGVDGSGGEADFEELRRRHLVPEVPYGQGRAAADAGATAMTDVSDGLIADLGHIADASGVGIDVATAALAVDHDALAALATVTGHDPWTWVLGGGEDHALVATFPAAPPAGWRRIGVVLDGPARVLVDGSAWRGSPGWQSF
jgi:thiamine-monophosphate kinase